MVQQARSNLHVLSSYYTHEPAVLHQALQKAKCVLSYKLKIFSQFI